MTKAEIIATVQEKVGEINKKQAGLAVDAVFDVLKDAIKKDGRLAYPSFGTFTVKTRQARTGRNPHNGEAIEIPATNTVSFKPSPKLKESLNEVKAEAKKEVKKAAKAEVKAADDKKACKKGCKKSK